MENEIRHTQLIIMAMCLNVKSGATEALLRHRRHY